MTRGAALALILILAGGSTLLTTGCAGAGKDDGLSEARAAYQSGSYDDCVRLCNAALEAGADPVEAVFLRAKAYERKGEHARAISDFDAVRREEPARGEAAFRQARCQLALGQVDQAEATAQWVIARAYGSLGPRDQVLARAVYGEIHLAAGRPSKAVEEFDAAIKAARASSRANADPAVAVVHYNLSRAHFELGGYRRARECYEDYLGSGRPAGEDLYTLGVLKFLCGDVRGARETAARLPAELKARMETVLSGEAFSVRALYDPPAANGNGER